MILQMSKAPNKCPKSDIQFEKNQCLTGKATCCKHVRNESINYGGDI